MSYEWFDVTNGMVLAEVGSTLSVAIPADAEPGDTFVYQVTVNEDQACAVIPPLDDVGIEYLLIKGTGFARHGVRLGWQHPVGQERKTWNVSRFAKNLHGKVILDHLIYTHVSQALRHRDQNPPR